MKLDIVRAWKDEGYRQSLSEEQMDTLPANPAGELELADGSLSSVLGAGGAGPIGPGVGPVGAVAPVPAPVPVGVGGGCCCCGTRAAFFNQTNFHSLAFRCNETLFSVTTVSGLNILSPVTPICVNEEE